MGYRTIGLDKAIRSLSLRGNIVKKDRKAKLRKEKAVEIILSEDGNYMDLYILASNKYIYMVSFIGKSQADLDNTDYVMIKDSFRLKDATTNFKALYILGVIVVIAISAFVKFKKSMRGIPMNY